MTGSAWTGLDSDGRCMWPIYIAREEVRRRERVADRAGLEADR